jgi:quercetin dioxygenase-like cupin family protein
MKRLPVYTIDEVPHDQKLHGGRMNRMAIRNENALVMIATLKPFEKMPPAHRHPYDQLVIVLGGTLMEVVEGVEYELTAGKAMVVPAGALHTGSARGDVDAKLVEIFSPVRKDYVYLTKYQKEKFKEEEGVDWFFDPKEEKEFTEKLIDRSQAVSK